ncbi:Serine/threonine-protein phosphatase 5 [Cichlidogyrus casuarinus]|uniref:protein-serine/threonine phosphatase n=1 Tax=Cichlidogyrus casuarinus TaxID=1844966 RepID=A0ABD2QAB1_9PLAT
MQRYYIPMEEAEKHKKIANDLFKGMIAIVYANFVDGKYQQSIEAYSKAIDILPNAILYANRSFAYVKTELFGLALDDANKAIGIDPNYVKAYYRRASAHMALGAFEKALDDFKAVIKIVPNDMDAKNKFNECNKIVKRKKFEKAIASEDQEDPLELFDPTKMSVEETYTGPHLEQDSKGEYAVTATFMESLLDWYKDEKRLHKKYAMIILKKIKQFFAQEPSMVDIDVPDGSKFTICGDVHGQFYDLLNIFNLNGQPSESNPYLFNGDFVDRGSFSVECIFTLFGFKLLYPRHFYMSRGNHESDNMNQMYGFANEVKEKYSLEMFDIFSEIFNWLPLCHLINDRIMVMHGGIVTDPKVTLDDIRKVMRNCQPPESGPMCELLWSDPHDGTGVAPSKRGSGKQFGSDMSLEFCERHNIDYIVRSHEVKDIGYEVAHDGRCITVFSAPNYCDTMGNQGAFINLVGSHSHKMEPEFVTFKEVPHPNVKPMAYANSMLPFLFC